MKPHNWKTPKNQTRVIKENKRPDPRLIEIKDEHPIYLDFKRATGRDNYQKPNELNEKRFELINHFPPNSTKTK